MSQTMTWTHIHTCVWCDRRATVTTPAIPAPGTERLPDGWWRVETPRWGEKNSLCSASCLLAWVLRST